MVVSYRMTMNLYKLLRMRDGRAIVIKGTLDFSKEEMGSWIHCHGVCVVRERFKKIKIKKKKIRYEKNTM